MSRKPPTRQDGTPVRKAYGIIDTYDDDDDFIDDDALTDHYLLTAFPIWGVGFTAPKGKIRLTMNVTGDSLENVAQIVKHSGEKMVCRIYAARGAFADDR